MYFYYLILYFSYIVFIRQVLITLDLIFRSSVQQADIFASKFCLFHTSLKITSFEIYSFIVFMHPTNNFMMCLLTWVR